MQLKSLDGCRLAIGSYPHFTYNAINGGGNAKVISGKEGNILKINFTPDKFSIPPLTFKTTKFLNLPLPPGLKIEMYMNKLEGTIDSKSGEVLLNFEARFILSILSIFEFPELFIKTTLETAFVKSSLFEEHGLKRQKDGKIILVGIAEVPVTGNKILDFFLDLPNEALAVLKCKII